MKKKKLNYYLRWNWFWKLQIFFKGSKGGENEEIGRTLGLYVGRIVDAEFSRDVGDRLAIGVYD